MGTFGRHELYEIWLCYKGYLIWTNKKKDLEFSPLMYFSSRHLVGFLPSNKARIEKYNNALIVDRPIIALNQDTSPSL